MTDSAVDGKPGWVSRILQRFSGPASGGASSIQAIAWNVVVAGLAIGGGYLAIRFTGGEEEFGSPEEVPNMLMGRRMAPIVPNRQPQLDQEQQDGEDTVVVEDLGNEDEGSGSYDDLGRPSAHSIMMGEEDRYFGDTGMKPSWVDELLEKLEQVDTKLDDIKAAVIDKKGKSAEGDSTSADDSIAKITDFYKIEGKGAENELLGFESAIQEARDALRIAADQKGGNKKSLNEGLGALRMYVNMIVENPDIPRYRRIATSNQSFKTLIAPIEGHETFLKSLGFIKKSSCYEWLDTAPSSSSSSSSASTEEGDSKKAAGDDEASSQPPDIGNLSREDRLQLLKRGFELL
jgi:hypothetical protein